MNLLKYSFITFAAFSTIIFFYCMASIVFHEYSRYLHDLATFSLLGIIIGCVFGSLFNDKHSQKTSKSNNSQQLNDRKIMQGETSSDDLNCSLNHIPADALDS